ncbi:hypothetical protein FKP32DRAFT_1590379 [Trametes sanguinea]|nr:hypothetical protein FKP32DRAFT_1590379 [Trametes sanguinea]
MLDVSNSHADLFRSYNHAKALLPDRLVSSRRVAIMCAAAATLGRIVALLGLTFGRHFMHPEVQSALARLGVDDWGERLAGVLVLHELAAHGREWFASHAGAVLDALVREGLERDPRMEVGEGATRVISVCRDVIEEQRKQEGKLRNALRSIGCASHSNTYRYYERSHRPAVE